MSTTIEVLYRQPRGFRAAGRALIAALESGDFQHEAREAQREKNLLAVGAVEVAFVIDMLRAARGNNYTATPHHWDSSVMVHTFRTRHREGKWYTKAYFLEDEVRTAVFISVHRQEDR